MTSRFRSFGPAAMLILAIAGCDEVQPTTPIPYRESERAATELAAKPKLRERIKAVLAETFGPDVQHMKVPTNPGLDGKTYLRDGGLYLADRVQVGDKVEPVMKDGARVQGGYALYRNNCLQCHGVFGAGDGPTSTYLYPKPRDYRPGIFKFTSTNPTNAKPARDDLRRTLLYGLHGTSMPGFEAILTADQIEQVIDYMTFLSIRGEVEKTLVDEAALAGTDDPEALASDIVAEFVQKVTSSWVEAEAGVVKPAARRVEATPESIRRGRDLFLGANTEGPKLECVGCHGANGQGNGAAFVDRSIFDDVVFRFYSLDEAAARTYRAERERAHAKRATAKPTDPAEVAKFLVDNPPILKILRDDHKLLADSATNPQFEYLVKNSPAQVGDAALQLLPELADPEFRSYLVGKYDLWTKGSLDFWNNPLRAANLTDGVYKGGRRPIDLYWRLAKGINGAKMPAHAGILSEEQIWDVVNFVLALPDQPDLLKPPAPSSPAHEPETKTAAAH